MKSFKAYANTKHHAIETVFGHHSQPEPYIPKTVFGKHSQSKPIKEAFNGDLNRHDTYIEHEIHRDHDAEPKTKDEKNALDHYTHISRHINELLHKTYRGEKTHASLTKNKSVVKHLDKLLDHSSVKYDTHVYTGLPESPHIAWKKTKTPTNKPVKAILPAYTSTSTDYQIARNFAKRDTNPDYKTHKPRNPDAPKESEYGNSGNHILKLHVPKGTRAASIRSHSKYDEENEVLLHRGHQIEIDPHPSVDNYRNYVWHGRVVGHNPHDVESTKVTPKSTSPKKKALKK